MNEKIDPIKIESTEDKTKVEKMMENPVFTEAYSLLHKSIVLFTKGGEIECKIFDVEPFLELTEDTHIRDFDSKDRKPGEIFIAWFRGIPMVNMVIDAEKRGVVWIKQVKIGDKKISVPTLLSQNLDLNRKNFPDYRKFQEETANTLDGRQILHAEEGTLIRIIESPETGVGKIIHKTRDRAKNSMGTMTKVV